MSGSPQVSIATEFYRIRLYKTFRRSVPMGSNYFADCAQEFSDLFDSKKETIDAIINEALNRCSIELHEFSDEACAAHAHALVLSSEDLERDTDMHDIHVELQLMPSACADEIGTSIMSQLFMQLNDRSRWEYHK